MKKKVLLSLIRVHKREEAEKKKRKTKGRKFGEDWRNSFT